MVDESPSDDNSVGLFNPKTMEDLGLFRGDTVIGKPTPGALSDLYQSEESAGVILS
jgi:hypothetical protein